MGSEFECSIFESPLYFTYFSNFQNLCCNFANIAHFPVRPTVPTLFTKLFKGTVQALKLILNQSCVFFLARRDVLDRGVHCCHPQAGFELDSKHFLGRSFCSGKASGS